MRVDFASVDSRVMTGDVVVLNCYNRETAEGRVSCESESFTC